MVKAECKGDVCVWFWDENDDYGFVSVYDNENVDVGLDLGNEVSKTWCSSLSSLFDGLDDTTLAGKDGLNDAETCHRCVRLVGVELRDN